MAERAGTSDGRDSQPQPKGPIKRAQDNPARACGARQSFFVTNGTSTANKIVAQAMIQPGDIVLVNTAAGAAYGTPAYVGTGCGIGREATNWMTERGMRVCGTDAWSWDAPFTLTACWVSLSIGYNEI